MGRGISTPFPPLKVVRTVVKISFATLKKKKILVIPLIHFHTQMNAILVAMNKDNYIGGKL